MKMKKNFLNNIIRHSLRATVAGAALVMVSACADEFDEPEAAAPGQTIAQIATASDDFDLLTAALTKTGLAASFANNNSGNFTVFAPNDAAFITYLGVADEATALTTINSLSNTSSPTITALAGILNYHVLGSEVKSAQVTGAQTFNTLNNNRLSISKQGEVVTLNGNLGANGATVLAVDIDASNGVIHVIDRVMSPISTNNILNRFGMSVSYSTATPTITGGLETGGDATTTDWDVLAYALRKSELAFVLVPNSAPLPEWTIFAPNDGAFVAYLTSLSNTVTNEATAITYLRDVLSKQEVTNLVLYHVLTTRRYSTDLSNSLSLATGLTGKSVTVNVNGATITLTDLNAGSADATVVAAFNAIYSNGTVHSIDRVLLAQ